MRCTIYGAFVFLGSNLRATATPVNKDGNVAPSLQAATLQALEVRADSTAPAN
ncbi:MAG: hypothetical protein M1830_005520, partial [Pleopsidium flavum]